MKKWYLSIFWIVVLSYTMVSVDFLCALPFFFQNFFLNEKSTDS